MTAVLEDKNILLISPQPWGRMFVSKHHYAVELCRRGNRVTFLEGPRESGPSSLQVRPVDDVPGLRVVSRRTRIPTWLRFKARPIYDALVEREILAFLRELGTEFDLVWSFEPNVYGDFRAFRAPFVIYHPVDMVETVAQISVARSADLVLSVAENILEKFRSERTERHFINHGLGPDFVRAAERHGSSWTATSGPRRVGYVGNLFIQQIDRTAFRNVVTENPDVEIHVWGPTEPKQSNVGVHEGEDIARFVKFLQASPNVRLRGVSPARELSEALYEMDAFLLCYDPIRDPAAGANSHKILEYLSTGRVVIANHVATYAGRDDLLVMAQPGHNRALPGLFRSTMSELERHNSPEATSRRARFALAQSYEQHVARVDRIIEELQRRRTTATRKSAAFKEI